MLSAARAVERLQQQSTQGHREVFYSLIGSLVRLRRDGTLDDDEFNKLVKRAAAASIEAEVADRVERGLKLKVRKVLEDKIRTGYLLSLQR